MLSIKCVQCGKEHKATSDKFPIARKEMRYIEAEKTLKPVIVGYLCKWCVKKHIRKEEAKNATKQQSKQYTPERTLEERPEVERKTPSTNKNLEIKKQGIISKIFHHFQKEKKT